MARYLPTGIRIGTNWLNEEPPEKDRRWRNCRVPPTSAIWCTPPVHRTTREGALRVECGRTPSDLRSSQKVKVSDAGSLQEGRAGAGAGVRKPPKEETAGRKGAVGARPMGICGWRTGRVRRGGSRRRSVLAAEPTTADVFDRGTAQVCRVRSGRVRTGDIAQTSRSCSGAGLEAKAIDGARRDAWRRS